MSKMTNRQKQDIANFFKIGYYLYKYNIKVKKGSKNTKKDRTIACCISEINSQINRNTL